MCLLRVLYSQPQQSPVTPKLVTDEWKGSSTLFTVEAVTDNWNGHGQKATHSVESKQKKATPLKMSVQTFSIGKMVQKYFGSHAYESEQV